MDKRRHRRIIDHGQRSQMDRLLMLIEMSYLRKVRLRLCLVASMLIFPAILMACADSSPEVDALEAEAAYSRGLELREQGQLRNAFDEFNEALSLNPRFAEAYSARASIYYAFGDEARTISDLNVALRLNPEVAEAYYYQGLIYVNKGSNDDAVINFNKALQLDPDNANAYYNRARVYFAMEDLDAALDDLTAALEIEKDAAQLYFLRGQVYLMAEETEKGIADIERTVELAEDEELAANAKQLLALLR